MNNKIFHHNLFVTYILELISKRYRWLMLHALIIFVVLLVIELSVGNSYYLKNATILSVDVLLRVTFFVGLILTGSVFSMEIFRGLHSRSQQVDIITTPISPFQEWIARWLFQFISALIVYTIAFYLADIMRLVVFRHYPHVELFSPSLLLRDFLGISDIKLPIFLLYFFATTFSGLSNALFVGRSIRYKFIAILFYLLGITLLIISIRLLFDTYNNHDGKDIYLYMYLVVSSIAGSAISYGIFRSLKVGDR